MLAGCCCGCANSLLCFVAGGGGNFPDFCFPGKLPSSWPWILNKGAGLGLSKGSPHRVPALLADLFCNHAQGPEHLPCSFRWICFNAGASLWCVVQAALPLLILELKEARAGGGGYRGLAQ